MHEPDRFILACHQHTRWVLQNTSNADLPPTELVLFLEADNSNCSAESGSNFDQICRVFPQSYI